MTSPMSALLVMVALGLGCAAGCSSKSEQPANGARDATDATGDVATGGTEVSGLHEYLKESSQQTASGMPAGQPGTAQTVAPQPSAASLPRGHPPITPDIPAPPAFESVSELKYDVPASWQSRPPGSAFRKAEYVLPRIEADPEDGTVMLYYFGRGEGGSVEANLARWRGMFTTPEGRPVPNDAIAQEVFEAGGLTVTVLDVTGRYADPMTPGRQEPTQSDYRMLAAIVDTPDGPWFFKGVGPAETMASQREAFVQMMHSIRR